MSLSFLFKINLILVSLFLLLSCNSNQEEKEIETQTMEIQTFDTLENLSKKETIVVLDTDFSKGRLTNQQEISLWDVQKLHGHLCDGLVMGFMGLRFALNHLYSDTIIDRTNLRIVAKSSPCIGDVGIYLTGARYQFNTFYVDNTIDGMYIVQRIDNGKTFSVHLKQDVKPFQIDSLGKLAVKQELSGCDLKTLKAMEDDFSMQLFNSKPNVIFELKEIHNFEWNPILNNHFIKTDIINKHSENCH